MIPSLSLFCLDNCYSKTLVPSMTPPGTPTSLLSEGKVGKGWDSVVSALKLIRVGVPPRPSLAGWLWQETSAALCLRSLTYRGRENHSTTSVGTPIFCPSLCPFPSTYMLSTQPAGPRPLSADSSHAPPRETTRGAGKNLPDNN